MQLPVDFTDPSLVQTSASTAGVLIGGLFGIQKLLKAWRGNSVELDLIKAMHEELNRVSAYNKIVSEELGQVQKEFLDLNKVIRELSNENQQLHYDVKKLTLEVERLTGVLNFS